MAALLKIFIGLMVIVCLAQFVEMAPEEDASDTANKLINQLSEQIKSALSDENLKKVIDGASSVLSEGAKTFESQMKDWKEKLGQLGDKNN